MWFILITVLVILCTVIWWKNRKLVKLSNQLKTDVLCLPIIGHAYKFIGTDEGVADPELAECVSKRFLEKGELFKRFLSFYVGNASFVSSVHIWRPRRKLMVHNFTPERLNQFFKAFVEQTDVMIEQLMDKVDAGPFPVWQYFTTFTLDLAYEFTTGQALNSQKNHDHPILKNFKTIIEQIASRLLRPWQHSDVTYKLFPVYKVALQCKEFVKDYSAHIIKTTQKSIKEMSATMSNNETTDDRNQSKLISVVETFIQRCGGMDKFSEEVIKEEVSVFLLAATDTTAITSSSTLAMLARHPDIQDKVYEEIKEVFGDSKRPVTLEDIPRLKYLEAVIKETLRFYPPVPVIVRQCDQDFTLPNGVTILKGCEILIHIWALHRNKKYWGEDAESFRPERFLESPLKHPAQFMPFSYGPRNCMGYRYAMMAMKTNFATLLRNFRILPETPAPPEGHKPLRLKFRIMLQDADNFMIQLEPRN